MSKLRLLDSPISWAIVGFAVGIGLGATSESVWLVALGLGAFIVYLTLHEPADPKSEGWLMAGGVVFILGWMAGFVVRGLTF